MFHPAFDFSRIPQKASKIKITVLTADASSCFLFDIQQINVCKKPNAKNNPNLKVGKNNAYLCSPFPPQREIIFRQKKNVNVC